MRTATTPETFWSRVDRRGPDECWPWIGLRDKQGYGQISWSGRTTRAHRLAWALTSGETMPSPDMHICHKCDNPPCVNPAHLWVGTNLENTLDKAAKGRCSNGKENMTHCRRGHEFTNENTYVTRGRRQCRACNRASVIAYRSRKREQS